MAMVKDQFEGLVTEGAGRMESAYGDLAGDGRSQLKGKMTQAKGAAQRAYGDVRVRAEDALARTREGGKDVYDATVEQLRQNPLLGVAAGVAFGLLLGLAVRGGSRRD
jgi:uncharacterized protein YjbJ (UPF0337 family)